MSWTDTVGAATLRSRFPAPADRFAAWTPLSRPVGEARVALGTGATHLFAFRDDHGASFEVRGISAHRTGGVYPLELANRLVAHLLRGGQCVVHPEDHAGSVYPTCAILPGTTPTLVQADARALDYTLALGVLNLAGAPMVCRYGSTSG